MLSYCYGIKGLLPVLVDNNPIIQLHNKANLILSGIYIPDAIELVSVLSTASDQYYNEGESYLLDNQYDALETMLKQLDPSNSFLAAIGSEVRGGKIKLPHVLGSLDQVYAGDVAKWITVNKWQQEHFVLSNKEDGVSALVIYGRNGLLQIAYSRGNGTQGADITRHIKRMQDVPKKMSTSCAVRCEVIMEKEVFYANQHLLLKSDKTTYQNPRGYVAGRMNASESPEWFYDNVRVIGTSVVEPKKGKLEQFAFLSFNKWAVPNYRVHPGNVLTDEYLTEFLNQQRIESKTEIDGIVIDINDINIRSSLRRDSSSINPMYSKKYKVGSEDNVATPNVVKVHWEPSKDAYLKPRVEIEPTQLMGVTVTYCTGFNAKFIRDNKIGPGAKIQITRSGDVIPFIQKVIQPADQPQLPTEDVFGALEWTKGYVDLRLVDPSNSREVLINILIDVFTKLDVPGLRQGGIEKLIDAGYLTAVDVIKASQADLQQVLGQSSGQTVHKGIIQKLNPVELHTLAGASQMLGRGIGRRKMAKLLSVISKDEFLSGSLIAERIIEVDGFERTTAEVLLKNQSRFFEFLHNIQGYYALAEPTKPVTNGKLSAIAVCFTGVRDKVLEAKMQSEGAVIADKVNAATTHLVCKDKNSTSSKMGKAREFESQGSLTILDLGQAQKLWN